MRKLNKETNKYGINFPIDEIQFGKYVNFLDVTLYIDEHNQIQYKSYSNPTDAKRYLRPQSFHPKNVFVSVPLSQMMRTIERNSVEETKKVEMNKMIEDFVRSGYKLEELKKVEAKATEQYNAERPTEDRRRKSPSPSSSLTKSTNSRRSSTMPGMTCSKRLVIPKSSWQ